MHIVVTPKGEGQRPFTLCGTRPSNEDISPLSAMFVSREFLQHIGVCPTCAQKFRYPDRVRLPYDSGKVREQRP